MNPNIDPAIQALIPDLAAAELHALEDSLLHDGCLDPLIVWRGRNVLLDGHNRLRVCQAHDIPFKTTEIDLPNLDAAKVWVIRHQFGRRNLTPFQKAELAVRLKPLIAAQAKANQRAGGGSGSSGRQKSTQPTKTRDMLAEMAGVSPTTLGQAEYIIEHAADDMKEQARTGELSINSACLQTKRTATEAKREEKRQRNRDLIKNAPDMATVLRDARFSTIVVDPPWDYQNGNMYGRCEPEYATLPLDEIKAMRIADHADANSHIYLWVPNMLVPDGFAVLDAWGFDCRSLLTWCKPGIGMGQYFRGSSEQILFGVKGSQMLKRKDVGTWFEAPTTRHSAKPENFYKLVESCSPGPYLDVLTRHTFRCTRCWRRSCGWCERSGRRKGDTRCRTTKRFS